MSNNFDADVVQMFVFNSMFVCKKDSFFSHILNDESSDEGSEDSDEESEELYYEIPKEKRKLKL